MDINQIKEALSTVVDPDSGKDIVALDAVDVDTSSEQVKVTVRTTNAAMHARKRLKEAVEFALERKFGKEFNAQVDIEAQAKEQTEPADSKKPIPGVKQVIAIASGKGGVGKSTVTANLAVSLAAAGFRVGLVDADIYGPSMPTMFDLVDHKPRPVQVGQKKYIEPLMSYGVKMLSIGFFTKGDEAVVWRGPMASKALKQLFYDAHWGELDYLLIDLPPGTGDIHLTLVSSIPLDGAVIVTTPQEVALADARRGISMFRLDSIQVPVVGLVENMSWFTPEELPDNKYYIFGKDGGVELAERTGVPLLGQIPLVQSVREAGDIGRPAALQDNTPVSMAFDALVRNFAESTQLKVS